LQTEYYYEFEGIFNLRSFALTPGSYFYINMAGWSQNSGIGRVIIKQNSSLITGWTELITRNHDSVTWRCTVPSNVNITQTISINTQYILRYNIYHTNEASTGFTSGGTGISKFWVSTDVGGSVEVAYFDFITYPKAAGKRTVLDLLFTNNNNIGSGSTLVVTFDTHNLLNAMFANDLEGQNVNGATYRYLDCREWTGYS
jgi:hypothetical protein